MPAGTQVRIALPSRYRIVRHVANGGMASVWVAEDELLGRRVAVKVLGAAYAAEDRAHRRFLREARAGARLGDCRHVVTVYDLGEHGGSAFMVMEYFAGGTVADRLARGMAIPQALALRWLREAAAGLDCAHGHDVVHRDVKPANLMLDQRGRLAVGDFGIATVATEASVTQTGQVLGTAAYISPEQARGRRATDASDRYALAVVAYELLTGSRPFAGEHPAAQARAHVEAAVPYASDVHDGLPPAVDRVLQAGMAKDPRRRPASAADLVDGLEDALDGADEERFTPATAVTAPVARRPPTTGRSAPVATRPPRRRLPAVVAALALVFVSAAAIAIAMGAGGAGSGSPSATSAAKEPAQTARHTTSSSSKTSTQRRTTTASGTTAAPTTTQATTATGEATTAATTPAQSPAALNNQGFALLQRGQAAAALPLLQRSVAAFRAAGATGSLDYAYALYNLANALRLSGRPAEAVPMLEERLQVSANQRGVVQRELARARAQAGGAPADQGKGEGKGEGKGGGKGKGRGRGRGDG